MRAMNLKSVRHASRLRNSLARTALVALLVLPLSSCADAPPRSTTPPTVMINNDIPIAARAAIDRLFSDREAMGETRALIILRDGEPIYEAYGPGYWQDSKLISWSMAKSITSVLVGILVSDGRLVLDDPAPVPEWQRPGDPRGTITLRQLLHMASGLEHVETAAQPWEADTVAMLFGGGAGNMAAMAEAKPPVAQPDEVFNYSTPTSVILSDIIARSLTTSTNPAVRRDAVREFITGRLSGPLEMPSLTPEFDASGTMIGGSIMHATARDYAKFGEFLRRRGETPEGQRLVPESWINFMLAPSPANNGYGGHIWLNRPDRRFPDPPLWPAQGPADLFACLGHQGQFIVVSPSQRLTVVRLGISIDDTQIPNVNAALREAMAAL
jgi:CubicO group peptidase (beta-lactamase class C family)